MRSLSEAGWSTERTHSPPDMRIHGGQGWMDVCMWRQGDGSAYVGGMDVCGGREGRGMDVCGGREGRGMDVGGERDEGVRGREEEGGREEERGVG